MPKINITPDCGNSPRKEFIRDFNIAFAEKNKKFITDSVHDNIQWNIYGDKKIDGKSDLINAIEGMKDYEIEEITIHSIITHGKEACANGEMLMKDGKKFAFCDVYEFISAGKNKIRKMYSYVLEDTL